MCLLVALSGVVPGAPLIMAANRDELLARPAVAMTTLRAAAPRILGGRDQLAGGTWLAVNEHGVVAGLTNRPSAGGRDASLRSRGEIPLILAAHRTAAEAVRDIAATLDPASYNPCWLLVGDRQQLFFVEIADAARPRVEELGPGLHILENAPLRARSAKSERVARLVAAERAARAEPDETADTVAGALAAVLRDHLPAEPGPDGARPAGPGSGEPGAGQHGAAGAGPAAAVSVPGIRVRPPAISAACVHTAEYGTRSSLIVTVPAAGLPRMRVADGPPCQAPLLDVSALWTGPALV